MVSTGSWSATAFVSFTPFGRPSARHQGGTLDITVTLSPAGKSPMTGVSMTVNGLINKPANLTGSEGVTVVGTPGNFTQAVRGETLFSLNE